MPDSRPQPPGREGAAPDAPVLVLSGARLPDGRTVDVRLSGGRVEAVGTAGSLTGPDGPSPAPGPGRARGADPGRDTGPGRGNGVPAAGPAPAAAPRARIDLTGYLLLPAPAEPHAHTDTALTAGTGGPASYTAADVQRRTTEAALLALGHGATAVRSHVRIGGVHGLGALEGALQARQALDGLTDLTAVAVPRVLTGIAGADGLATLRDALKMGAAVVGGCPDLDPDPAGYVETVLAVAAEHGCPVDLHTEGDDPVRLARLAAMAGGLRPGVTIGPCTGLGLLPRQTAARTADRLAAAGVTVVCLPQGDCPAMERDGTVPPPPSAPAAALVRLLRAAGVRVAAGSGALRDAANPVGRGDPLEAAFLLAAQAGERVEDAYAAVCARAREAMGLPEVRLEAGFPAELLAVRGRDLAGVLSLAYSRLVVHRGRVVARTSAVREYCDSEAVAALDLPRQGRQPGGGAR
ncbi:amidohydrolase family protein [Streptomyces lycii]|uniref:Hydrolase n=1 Tax=Streptomyces lycii TaxID=2654337 RepID=A0ABQ7FFP7_9ACTN|nr:amidohydrolase family protein [Streptomyces lycii]KAF4407831.1 hydrolase [Streptomyces lycii]